MTVTTPFTPDDMVDEVALRANLRMYANHHSADYPIGFVACGTYGESLSMTEAERQAVIKVTVEQAGKDIPVIAPLVSGDSCLDRLLDMARYCETVGVDAICLAPPTYYFKPGYAGIEGWISCIAREVGIGLVLYNLAGRLGFYLEPCKVARLALNIPSLVGMKLAAPSLEERVEMINAVGETIAVIEGAEPFSPHALPIGATGYMASSAAFAPALMVRWTKAILESDTRTLSHLQDRFVRYRRLQNTATAEPPALIKAAMNCVGLAGGPVRLPLAPLNDAEDAELRESLLEIGLPAGPYDAPMQSKPAVETN